MHNKESTICHRCHRKLKDDESKKRGFGKVCYEKYIKQKINYLFEMRDTNEIVNK